MSTKQGFGEMIVAKWKSLMRHISNNHTDHPDQLFDKCTHGQLQQREWLKIGTLAVSIHSEAYILCLFLMFTITPIYIMVNMIGPFDVINWGANSTKCIIYIYIEIFLFPTIQGSGKI